MSAVYGATRLSDTAVGNLDAAAGMKLSATTTSQLSE